MYVCMYMFECVLILNTDWHILAWEFAVCGARDVSVSLCMYGSVSLCMYVSVSLCMYVEIRCFHAQIVSRCHSVVTCLRT